MKKPTKNTKYIPTKNYLYFALTIIALALICWYILSWYNVKKKEKYLESYLISTNTVNYEINNLDEINQVLLESPSEYFVYISYTGNEDIYKLEKQLKKSIDTYNLKDSFYYLDITDIKNEDNIISKLNDTFNTRKIKAVPTLIYFANNEIEDIIQVKNGLFSNQEFINLLKNNDYIK